jgi:ribosomal protein L34
MGFMTAATGRRLIDNRRNKDIPFEGKSETSEMGFMPAATGCRLIDNRRNKDIPFPYWRYNLVWVLASSMVS